jgi:hypothetical protein
MITEYLLRGDTNQTALAQPAPAWIMQPYKYVVLHKHNTLAAPAGPFNFVSLRIEMHFNWSIISQAIVASGKRRSAYMLVNPGLGFCAFSPQSGVIANFSHKVTHPLFETSRGRPPLTTDQISSPITIQL